MAADSGRLREACAPAHTGSGTHQIQVIAWRSVLLTGLRHGDYAHRCSRGIPSWRRGHLSALRHSHPAHRYSRGISSWRRGHLSALRHGHPAHRCLRGILAWQRGLLTDLRHVGPQVPQGHPRVSEAGTSTGVRRNASRRGTGCSTRGGEIRP